MSVNESSQAMTQMLIRKYDRELKDFEDWIKTKPHLPQDFNKVLLLRYLKVYDFDMEKSKKLLLLNLEMRKKNIAIFENRDILSEGFQQVFNIVQMCPLPKANKNNEKISVFRLIDCDPDKYIYLDMCRVVVSILDVRFVTVDENELLNGEVGVIDMSGFTFKHVMKSATNLSVMRSYMKYVQEAVPVKIGQNHFINCPPVMNKFMTLVKPFMKKELLEQIIFHPDLDSLHAALPKELLPEEYGGTAGKLDDIYSDWLKVVEDNRDYILNDDNWKLDDE